MIPQSPQLLILNKSLVKQMVRLVCDNKSNQVFFISTTWEISVNRIDLQAPVLVGPPHQTQDLDLLAVQPTIYE